MGEAGAGKRFSSGGVAGLWEMGHVRGCVCVCVCGLEFHLNGFGGRTLTTLLLIVVVMFNLDSICRKTGPQSLENIRV